MTFRAKKKNSMQDSNHPWVGDDIYLVEGLSAVADHLKKDASSVLLVASKDINKSSLAEVKRNLLPQEIVSVDEWCKKYGPAPSRSPLWAYVKIESREERDLDTHQPVILALDHILDPRNLGAIARTAAFFGIRQIIVSDRRQVLLTQSAVQTSQSAFCFTDLVVVTNISRTLRNLKDQGYWIIGADVDGQDIGATDLKFDRRVFVLGNEQQGLSKVVKKVCDLSVSIKGSEIGPQSLNVSVAAGIGLHSLFAK